MKVFENLATTDEDLASFDLLPLDDRIVLIRDTREEMFHGAVYLPERGQESKVIGTVIATGPGKAFFDPSSPDNIRYEPMFISLGDRVLFGKYAGTDINWGGIQLTICRQEDIIAIIKRKSGEYSNMPIPGATR